MKIKAALTLATIFILSACSSKPQLHIDSDYDRVSDFTSYKTYKWRAPNEHNEKTKDYLVNDIMDQRIRRNIDEQLAAQGFQRMETGEVDFLVNYTVTSQDKIDIDTYNTYSGFAPGWSYGGFIGPGPYRYGTVVYGYNESVDTNTEITHHQEGTLVIDIISPETDKLMWRGTAEGQLPENQTRTEREKIATEAITKILSNFPPKKS